MTDTLVSKSSTNAPTELASIAKLPFEGDLQRAYYGEVFVERLRYAFNNGYRPRYGTDATAITPATDGIMTGLAALKSYADLIEFLYIPGVMTVNGSDQVQKLFSFGDNLLEAYPTTAPGPAAVGDSGNAYLDHSAGQGRGLLGKHDQTTFNDTSSGGKALIHIGREVAYPANGWVFRLVGGNNTYMSVGVENGGPKHRVRVSRRRQADGVFEANTDFTASAAADSPLNTWQTRQLYLGYASGAVRLDVDGVNKLPSTPWNGGGVGIVDASSPYDIRIAEPGVSSTWNTHTGPVCLLSTSNIATGQAVTAIIETHFAKYK